MGTTTIDKPSRGRVVEYRDEGGRVFSGSVDKFTEGSKRGEISLTYFGENPSVMKAEGAAFIGFARGVVYDGDGTLSNSWRYPPRENGKIEVER